MGNRRTLGSCGVEESVVCMWCTYYVQKDVVCVCVCVVDSHMMYRRESMLCYVVFRCGVCVLYRCVYVHVICSTGEYAVLCGVQMWFTCGVQGTV